MCPCPQVTLGLAFASAFLASCCQGTTGEGTHSWYMSPWAEKSMTAPVKEQLCSWSLRRAAGCGGIARQGKDLFPPAGAGLFTPPPQAQVVAMGKAVNTNRMKSTWKKWMRENYAKWKVTKCKRGGGQTRLFSQGTAWPSCCLPVVLCSLALGSSLPRPLLLQSLGMGPYTTMLKFVNLDK